MMSRFVPLWAKQMGERFMDIEGWARSGHLAFVSLLSLFPFLLFLTSLAGMMGTPELVNELFVQFMPFLPQEVMATLFPVIQGVLSQANVSLLSLAGVFALWGASASIEAVRNLLNRAFGFERRRPFIVKRLQNVVVIMIAAVVIFALTTTMVIAPSMIDMIAPYVRARDLLLSHWDSTRWLMAASMLVAVFVLVYRFLPSGLVMLRDVWVGSIVAAFLWLIMASFFSLYFTFLPNFALVYGGLTGMMITLLFFYFSAAIFTLGAVVNAHLRQRRLARLGTLPVA